MSETYVRIKGDYYQDEIAGQTAVLVEKNLGILGDRDLIGFPLDSPFGWYDEDMSTQYNLWYISPEYLEPVQVFSRSKFN
jgi:hypothetical protein